MLSPHNAPTTRRYALCEVVNLHDEGLAFEAIHRVLFHAGGLGAVDRACQSLRSQGAYR